MLTLVHGNILASQADAIVNPVNCEGVMGAGLALAFKKYNMDNFHEYRALCQTGVIQIGRVHFFEQISGPMIINFPTKDRWRLPSEKSYIVDGLRDLQDKLIDTEITSIAFPALGCGLGGLSWEWVYYVMQKWEAKNNHLHVYVYAPASK